MSDWILDSLGDARESARVAATRKRLFAALPVAVPLVDGSPSASKLLFTFSALELNVLEQLREAERSRQAEGALRAAAEEAFQLGRTLDGDDDFLLRLGCLATIADRGADFRRLVERRVFADVNVTDWGLRVPRVVNQIWLRLFRKRGWEDFDAVQAAVVDLRTSQATLEPPYLARQGEGQSGAAWQLVCHYHVAKAAEILAIFLGQGAVDGRFDVREQLDAQFDRALSAAARSSNVRDEVAVRLLTRAARVLVESSIWTVTRAVNSRVTAFVHALTSPSAARPIFEMLPPQRRTLREAGLLGSGHRSVVVSLPTSSGKTLIAQFRILQALNQFDHERGWVAYVAPTRALVNQLAVRLRRDFAPLAVGVEKLSPALEIDGLEAELLEAGEFRVLVATPEKLDMMLRGGWEERVGRPLTLVVVDEAHGLAGGTRGLRLELLLATINRECRHAQFLLLTPFVQNAAEIARWLAPDSFQAMELGFDWTPNDRLIAIASPVQTGKRGDFVISLAAKLTSKATLVVPEELQLSSVRPLRLTHSEVAQSPGKLAAAVAHELGGRGPVIVLADKPANTWGLAKILAEHALPSESSPDLSHIVAFLADEFGADFPLAGLLRRGVAVHHAGLSEDARTLVEALTERGEVRTLVATTTLAQGVNFPVRAIVLATYQHPYGRDFSHEEFWNIAGRAGRVDQGDLGLVVLAGNNAEKTEKLEIFLQNAAQHLVSHLVEMVRSVLEVGRELDLAALAFEPQWSAFVQFLAHTYRQIDDGTRFATEVEQILRGTLGFQALRREKREWADALLVSVYRYAARLDGKPLKLVDATGFSWETVEATLGRLRNARLPADVWTPELFGRRRGELTTMMGILLEIPEVRQSLGDVLGGDRRDGETLARMLGDWVGGEPLSAMARTYFGEFGAVDGMTRCCQGIFGKLTQSASWGLAALQALTFDADGVAAMSPSAQMSFRNLPARVLYGVDSDAAIALRMLGVPRGAAPRLAASLGISEATTLKSARAAVDTAPVAAWTHALGERGASYHRVWSLLAGRA